MKWKSQCFANFQQSRFLHLKIALFFALTIEHSSMLKKKEKKVELKRKELFYNRNSFQKVVNDDTTTNKRIEFVDEAKFTNFLSENKIYERQYTIFTIIASFSLFLHHNDFIRKAWVICIKRKRQCFVNLREKLLFFLF